VDRTNCSTCRDSGQISADADRMPLSVAQAKEKERDAWKGLVRRTKWKPCPDCGDPAKSFARKRKPKRVDDEK